MKINCTYTINRDWQKPASNQFAPEFGTQIDASRGPSM